MFGSQQLFLAFVFLPLLFLFLHVLRVWNTVVILFLCRRMDDRITGETELKAAVVAIDVSVILIFAESMTTDQIRRLIGNRVPGVEFKASIFV